MAPEMHEFRSTPGKGLCLHPKINGLVARFAYREMLHACAGAAGEKVLSDLSQKAFFNS